MDTAFIISGLTVFVLALFAGAELIARVPQTLHTPLMSGSNAISGIAILGALLVAGHSDGLDSTSLIGLLAVMFAAINVAGGYLVTHRMLQMFKKKGKRGE
jgi:NAD(P) transhydrogenase subunit alpha